MDLLGLMDCQILHGLLDCQINWLLIINRSVSELPSFRPSPAMTIFQLFCSFALLRFVGLAISQFPQGNLSALCFLRLRLQTATVGNCGFADLQILQILQFDCEYEYEYHDMWIIKHPKQLKQLKSCIGWVALRLMRIAPIAPVTVWVVVSYGSYCSYGSYALRSTDCAQKSKVRSRIMLWKFLYNLSCKSSFALIHFPEIHNYSVFKNYE